MVQVHVRTLLEKQEMAPQHVARVMGILQADPELAGKFRKSNLLLERMLALKYL